MKKVLNVFYVIFISCSASIEENSNKKTAIFFMENILDIEKVKPLLHENFNFTFMGNTIISKKTYNTEDWINQWNGEIIPALLPNGIELFIIDVISAAEGSGILHTVESDGING